MKERTKCVTQECSECGERFDVTYHSGGFYTYNETCSCEAEFSPVNGPSLSEWLEQINKPRLMICSVKELAQKLAGLLDSESLTRYPFPAFDFAIVDVEGSEFSEEELEYTARAKATGWYGVKAPDFGFGSSNLVLFADYYGGGCAGICQLYNGISQEDLAEDIKKFILETLTIQEIAKEDTMLIVDFNSERANISSAAIRDIDFHAGYYTWDVFVDGAPYYAFGDLAEEFEEFDEGCADEEDPRFTTITAGCEDSAKQTDKMVRLKNIVDDLVFDMVLETKCEDSTILTAGIEPLTDEELEVLKEKMVHKLGLHYTDLFDSN